MENDKSSHKINLKLPFSNEVQFTSFPDFRNFLIDLIEYIDEDEHVCIKLTSELYSKFINDQDLRKLFPCIFNEFEDQFLIKQFNNEESNIESQDKEVINSYSNQLRIFLDSYHHLNSSKFNNKSFRELVHEFVFNRDRINIHTNFNDWFITLDEYQRKYQLVINAVKYFRRDNKISNKLGEGLEINFYLDQQLAKDRLSELKEKLVRNRMHLYSYINQLNYLWNNDANKSYKNLYLLYLNLYQNYNKFLQQHGSKNINKPHILEFNKHKKQAFQDLENIRKQANDLYNTAKSIGVIGVNLQNYTQIEEIAFLLEQINAKLSNWKESCQIKFLEKANRISHLNTNEESLLYCFNELQEIIADFNNGHFLSNRIEFNSNLVIKQIEFANDLLRKIDHILEAYESIEFEQKSQEFMQGLSNSDYEFLNKFSSFERDIWIKVFEEYYYEKMLHTIHHPMTIDSEETGNKLFNFYNSNTSAQVRRVSNKLKSLLSSKLNNFRKENKDLFKRLVQYDQVQLKSDFYREDIQEFSKVYNLKLKPLNYGVSDIIVEFTSHLGNKVFEFNIDITDHEEAMARIVHSISDTPYVNRYGIARDLSYALNSYAHQIKIFQLKNANVISILPFMLSDRIINALDLYGVKEIRTNDREEEAVIESILECDRRQILLISDGLLNPQMPEHFFSQYKIIDAFKIAGFDIKWIWTVELLQKGSLVVDELINEIVGG